MMANRNDEALRNVRLAEAVARQAHAEHVDKSGAPYVGHLERVAAAVAPDADAMAVAWLHDLVEDQPHCAGYLMDFPPHIVRTVYLLTKVKNEPNALYFARIKADPLALKVKLADIADNMSEARMGKLGALTQERLRAKYAAALDMLTPRPEPAEAMGGEELNAPGAVGAVPGTLERGGQDANPAASDSAPLTAGDVDVARQPATSAELAGYVPAVVAQWLRAGKYLGTNFMPAPKAPDDVPVYFALSRPEPAGRVEEPDWRELWRFQTAMRYMDNNPKLTRERAFIMAAEDMDRIEAHARAAHAPQEGVE